MSNPIKSETKNTGFILVHRTIREHWIWEDATKLKWWLDILMECNHSDAKVSIGYEVVECKRGQSINSLLTWAKRWRVNVGKVRRFFKMLENDHMIDTVNVQKTTRLTVCNYDSYNTIAAGKRISNDILNGRQTNSERIQTKNEEITNKEGGEFSPTQIDDFKKFKKWINDHAPEVSKMKEPFTIKQFLEIKKDVPAAKISEVLKSMHNWPKLLKNNRSAYLTLLKWVKRDEKEKPVEEAKPSIPGTLRRLNPAS